MRCPDCGFMMDNGVCNNCLKPNTLHVTIPAPQHPALANYDSGNYAMFMSKANTDKALRSLEGIISGINFENPIAPETMSTIFNWCDKYRPLENKHPFSELFSLLTQIQNHHQMLSHEDTLDMLWLCQRLRNDYRYYDMVTSDIQFLFGTLQGIMSDNRITLAEMTGLKNWLLENDHLLSTYPYDELRALSISILEDGELSEEEIGQFKGFVADFIDFDCCKALNKDELAEIKKKYSLQGICSFSPKIKFPNYTFSFTGKSTKASRSSISDVITALGGKFLPNVSSKIDYLIVGNNGNPCWSFSCYGRKIEAAIDLRKNGHQIQIVNETDFWYTIESLS